MTEEALPREHYAAQIRGAIDQVRRVVRLFDVVTGREFEAPVATAVELLQRGCASTEPTVGTHPGGAGGAGKPKRAKTIVRSS